MSQALTPLQVMKDRNIVAANINDSEYQCAYRIHTKYLNLVNDEIDILLLKRSPDSPWVLTDDGWTDDDCESTGVFDENDNYTHALKDLIYKQCHYFSGSTILHNHSGYYLKFNSIQVVSDKVHQFMQLIISIFSNVQLIIQERKEHSRLI